MGGSSSLEKSFIGYAFMMLGIATAAYSMSASVRLCTEEYS